MCTKLIALNFISFIYTYIYLTTYLYLNKSLAVNTRVFVYNLSVLNDIEIYRIPGRDRNDCCSECSFNRLLLKIEWLQGMNEEMKDFVSFRK
jgi:hypothetical protein